MIHRIELSPRLFPKNVRRDSHAWPCFAMTRTMRIHPDAMTTAASAKGPPASSAATRVDIPSIP